MRIKESDKAGKEEIYVTGMANSWLYLYEDYIISMVKEVESQY